MSKYIDADRLKAEIERLKERAQAERVLHPKTILSAKNYLLIQDYDALLSFIASLQQEQPEVDLDALVDEAFDKYSSVDGYGQLSVSFNRAELYSLIKKIARKEG